MNYTNTFQTLGWEEIIPSGITQADTSDISFDVDMLVYKNAKHISSLIIYSHSTGTFESQEDATLYLHIFHETIQRIAELFPHYFLYYIQNYEGFDPSKQINYIREQSLISPVSDALNIIPFKKQRRICRNPPEAVLQAMPEVHFSQDIKTALIELGLHKKARN